MMLRTAATLLQPAIRARAFGCLSRQTLFIPLQRSSAAPAAAGLLASYSRSPFSTSLRSRAASEVSHKPASQDIPHAAQNAKEEASAVASTIAQGIAGKGGKGDFDAAEITRTQEATGKDHSIGDSFVQITQAVASTVPQPILVVGLLGGLPYLGAGLTTLYAARQATQAAAGLTASTDLSSAIALLDTCTHFQVTYGAVMLSFLGALHWGMEFAKYGGYKGYSRLALGVAPLLGAWPTLAMEPQLALVAQWFLFTSLWYADMKATMAGWTPSWYSQYRFYLSILAGTCILGTLFGINYFGPTTDVALAKHLPETGVLGSSLGFMDTVVKGEYEAAHKANEPRYAPGDSQFWTEEGEDGFVKILKKSDDEEGEGEGEDAEGEEGGESNDNDNKQDKEDGQDEQQEEQKDDSSDDKGEEEKDQSDQKNPRAGATGENIDSAKKQQDEGVLGKREGASKAKK